MKILGIDPGIENLGYACLIKENDYYKILAQGVLNPPSNSSYPEKLKFLFESLRSVIEKLEPEYIALEDILLKRSSNSINQVFQVQGVVLLLAGLYNINIKIFNPAELKQFIAKHGKASKKEITKILKILFDNGFFKGDVSSIKNHHIADALVIALCLAFELER